MDKVFQLAFGKGVGKSEQIWHDRNDLAAAGGTVSLDLSDAAGLSNSFGGAIHFDMIRVLMILNRSDESISHGAHVAATLDAELDIGGSGGNEWSGTGTPFGAVGDIITLQAGSILLLTNPIAAGWTVDPGVKDLLKIINNGGGIALYDIVLIGEVV